MRVSVIGAGYVGLVTGVGLASLGHTVRVGERDSSKLAKLQSGVSPIYETGLQDALDSAMAAEMISFHATNHDAISGADVVLLALPTPPAADGSADLSYVTEALIDLAPSIPPGLVVANKSTVPVGTEAHFQDMLDTMGCDAIVVSNPEFLREGSALHDFHNPDRIVIGTTHPRAADVMTQLYEKLDAPVIVTDPASSEMIKYASNAYLATRITFANAIANLCETVGADAVAVLEGMGLDKRIGSQFLKPGPGFGGSCFPKDTLALVSIAEESGYDFSLLRGVIAVNELQSERIVSKVASVVPSMSEARIALWGLTFKAGTDDTRESPALKVASRLQALGATLLAYDPEAQDTGTEAIPLASSALGAAEGADVLLIATEWPEFRDVDLVELRQVMSGAAIVDARNLLDPKAVDSAGLSYMGVGR